MNQSILKRLVFLLLPTILFFVCYSVWGILPAVIISGAVSFLVAIFTFIRTRKLPGSQLIGILGMIISFAAIYFTGNDKYYFLTPLVSNCILVIVAFILTIRKKSIFHLVAKPFKLPQIADIPESAFLSLNVMWLVALVVKTLSKLLGVLLLDFKTIYWIAYVLSDPLTVVLLIVSVYLVRRNLTMANASQSNEGHQSGRTTIYCFSATGNSLFAARTLASRIEHAEIRPMCDAQFVGEGPSDATAIGFVFPVYYGKLPRLVKDFIERLSIPPDAYCFAVVTSGGPGAIARGAVSFVHELLQKKGAALSYGKAIQFAGNYVREYDVAITDKTRKRLKQATQSTLAAAEEIRCKRHNHVVWPKIALNRLYKNIAALDVDFYADKNCVGCGICETVCPVQNIRLTESRPVWQHRCEHCFACINWCPKSAIQYGEKTRSRSRYHHPDVGIDDLLHRPQPLSPEPID